MQIVIISFILMITTIMIRTIVIDLMKSNDYHGSLEPVAPVPSDASTSARAS